MDLKETWELRVYSSWYLLGDEGGRGKNQGCSGFWFGRLSRLVLCSELGITGRRSSLGTEENEPHCGHVGFSNLWTSPVELSDCLSVLWVWGYLWSQPGWKWLLWGCVEWEESLKQCLHTFCVRSQMAALLRIVGHTVQNYSMCCGSTEAATDDTQVGMNVIPWKLIVHTEIWILYNYHISLNIILPLIFVIVQPFKTVQVQSYFVEHMKKSDEPDMSYEP